MELLIVTRRLRLQDGTIITPGEVIQAAHPDHLVKEGKARPLDHEDRVRILDAYVREAAEVFKVEGPICYACGGKDFWTSIRGVVVCRRCHPPARQELERKAG